jgi:AGCS family alanine or glycine:cation symporter
LDTWVSGLIVAVIFGAIVFGVKRIAKFTEFIVPNMAMDIFEC